MNSEIEVLINRAVLNILKRIGGDKNVQKMEKKHVQKIHFIPKSYRILGGMLQSINIQFGNFIEELMRLLIESEPEFEIIEKYSGKKSGKFAISKSIEQMIDEYITTCQTSEDGFCIDGFLNLQQKILAEDMDSGKLLEFGHDIDLLFRNRNTGEIFYLEIKYNDDHDTGKFVDINRKLIKTYAYLVREFEISTIRGLTPILFFFNNKKMKGNIFIPEKTNIFRGERFFNEFLSKISYEELSNFMENLSESYKVRQMFDELYDNVCKKVQ